MSVFQPGKIAYGFSQALVDVPIQAIIAQRNPNSNDKAPLGTFWIDQATNQVFVITSIVDNIANWATVATSGVVNTVITDSGTATPIGGVLNVFGGDNIMTSASGNTVDIATTGNIDLPATNAAGTQGIYKIGGVNFGFMFPPTSVYVGNAGNTSNNPLLAINNVGVGNDALTLITTGNNNTALGAESLTSVTTGTNNVAVGHLALNALDAGDSNVALGNLALESLDNGDENIAIGFSAGSNYTGSESDNILIGNQGVVAESNTMRLGTQGTGAGQQDVTFIAGVYGSTFGGTNQVVFINSLGKIGSSKGTDGQVIIGSTAGNPIWNTLTAGTNVTITNTANNIEIAVPGVGAEVIDGDTGSASGPVLTFTAAATGASTTFSASGTVVTLNLQDSNNNVILGKNANGTLGTVNVGLGNSVFHDLTTGATENVAIGANALDTLTTGTANIALGFNAGTNYASTETSNIIIGNSGTVAESHVIRIGTQGAGGGQQNECFVAGIYNTAFGGTNQVMFADSTGKLGSSKGTDGEVIIGSTAGSPIWGTLTAGTDITITNAANSITINSTSSAGIEILDGNTGSATGSTVTIESTPSTGGSSVTFSGSGATLTLSLTDAANNVFLGSSAGQPGFTSSPSNVGIGGSALNAAVDDGSVSENVAIGAASLSSLTGGANNTAIGALSGSNYTGSESNNILINNSGAVGESHTIRIGSGSAQTSCFIRGIQGVTPSGSTDVVIINSSGQLGSAASAPLTALNLPSTDTGLTVGVITVNGVVMESFPGGSNLFFGPSVGNGTLGGFDNIGIGSGSLTALNNGNFNIALGAGVLPSITDGTENIAMGSNAMSSADLCTDNICMGFDAGATLNSATAQYNIALGRAACSSVGTGSYNICIGVGAGGSLTTTDSSNIMILNDGIGGDNNTIRIGTQGTSPGQQDLCFIAGIFGTTVGVSGVPVVVDNTGNLGTVVSSRRYKENISDMDDASRPIMDLRPVTFNLKNDRTHERKFGLIAEEVQEIIPDLVVLNKEGDPETVKYQDLPVLLLNELQRQHNIIAELSRRLERLEGRAKYEPKN